MSNSPVKDYFQTIARYFGLIKTGISIMKHINMTNGFAKVMR